MGVKLFIKNETNSDAKAKQWLESHGITFEEINIFYINAEDIKEILRLSENGFDDFISIRSRRYCNLRKSGKLKEDMTIQEWIDWLLVYPEIMRTPLVLDEKRMQVGFNYDEIRKFIPKRMRQLEL
jgi:regulatory protein spx